jgi:protoporphyrinogen oxidase
MAPGSGRWAVVGAGVLGLTTARRLAQQGHEVVLFEAASEVGGLASAWTLGEPPDQVVWDRHYHVTLLSDARTRAMLADLGLEDEVRWVETKTGVYADGALHSVSNSVEYLRFPALNLVDKARLAVTILAGSRMTDWRTLEQQPVDEWLTKWSGKRTFERFWLPLLRAKLGDGYRDASAAFIWATIQRLYAARRSGLKKELFGYVAGGGYGRVLDRFVEVLREQGVELRLGTRVEAIRRGSADGARLTLAVDGADEAFDGAVVTLAGPLAARLCPDLDADERARLEGVSYMGIVCASLLLDRPLGGYYLTYLTDDGPADEDGDAGYPFTAVVEMTAFVDPEEVGGHHLVYLPRYVPPDHPLFEASDEEVRARFEPALRRLYPALTDEDVLAFRVSRVRQVFAVPTIDYSERIPPMVTSVPGLHLAGSAHLLNATLNVDDTLGLVDQVLEGIAADRPATEEVVT